MNNYLKKLEAAVAIVQKVNSRLVGQSVQSKRQCWENVEYSRCKCLEVIGIPTSVKEDVLEEYIAFLMKLALNEAKKIFKHAIE